MHAHPLEVARPVTERACCDAWCFERRHMHNENQSSQLVLTAAGAPARHTTVPACNTPAEQQQKACCSSSCQQSCAAGVLCYLLLVNHVALRFSEYALKVGSCESLELNSDGQAPLGAQRQHSSKAGTVVSQEHQNEQQGDENNTQQFCRVKRVEQDGAAAGRAVQT